MWRSVGVCSRERVAIKETVKLLRGETDGGEADWVGAVAERSAERLSTLRDTLKLNVAAAAARGLPLEAYSPDGERCIVAFENEYDFDWTVSVSSAVTLPDVVEDREARIGERLTVDVPVVTFPEAEADAASLDRDSLHVCVGTVDESSVDDDVVIDRGLVRIDAV